MENKVMWLFVCFSEFVYLSLLLHLFECDTDFEYCQITFTISFLYEVINVLSQREVKPR